MIKDVEAKRCAHAAAKKPPYLEKEMFCQTCLTRLVLVFALQIALCLTVPADAALIGFASGNTNPGDLLSGPGVDGTVNFGILDKSGGSGGDTFGTGVSDFDSRFVAGTSSPGFDTLTADYLYLFQVVNNGSNATGIVSFAADLAAGLFSSFGTFTATGFTDLEGVTQTEVSATNVFGPNTPLIFADPDPASLGVINPGITVLTTSSFNAPTSVTVAAGSINAFAFSGGELADGARSQLIGYTSDYLPILGSTLIVDGTSSANGTVITPTADPTESIFVPEPASLAIWGLGAFGLALFRQRRRRV